MKLPDAERSKVTPSQFGLQRDMFEQPADEGGAPWSDQEVLALLEAIDLHRDDWLKVRSMHAGMHPWMPQHISCISLAVTHFSHRHAH